MPCRSQGVAGVTRKHQPTVEEPLLCIDAHGVITMPIGSDIGSVGGSSSEAVDLRQSGCRRRGGRGAQREDALRPGNLGAPPTRAAQGGPLF
jgi:hypothetical protein